MLDQIPDAFKHLLDDETRAFAFLATTMEDGSPQVTPVWFNTDGDHILINSAEGRVKDRNMRARPRVALALMGMKDAYRYMQLRGEVVEISAEGGAEHIHALSHKYRGKDYEIPEGQVRVIYRIRVDQIQTM